MRSLAVSALLAAALTAVTPAAAATRDFPLTNFDRIDLGGVADVSVHTGNFAVHADGDPDTVAALLVENRRGTLFIGFRPGTHLSRGKVRIAVSMPRIVAAEASGAGSLAVDRVGGPGFTATLSGTGSLRLPAVQVDRLKVAVSGAGSALVAGRAGSIDLDLSGTGGIDAARLRARGGRIAVSGVGAVHALVDGPVDVSASGIGSVTVTGHPACTVHRSGIGAIHCG